MSGGRATVRMKRPDKKKMYAQSGDISAIDPLGAPLIDLFFVEAKHLQDLKLEQMLWQKEGFAPNIWDLPFEEANKYGKYPMVLARQDRQKTLVLTTSWGLDILRFGGHLDEWATIRRVTVAGEVTTVYVLSLAHMVTQIKWANVEIEARRQGLLEVPLKDRKRG
jgi:hypothetical protein